MPRRTSRVLFVGLCALALGCNHPTPRSQQQAALTHWKPAALAIPTHAPDAGPVAVVKVLVLVDDDYRFQSRAYEAEIVRQFGRASAYTTPALGVRFEVVLVQPWSHRAGNRTLNDTLAALERDHQGDAFDLVVGFVSSLPVVQTDHDQMGVARLLGRHLVLRGINDGAETAEFRRELTALHDGELEAFHRERKQHKQTTLLLHEWGHCLGAIHDTHTHGLMHPRYSLQATAFSANTLPLIRASLEPGPPELRAKRVSDELQRLAPDSVYGSERAQWIEDLRTLEKGPPPAAPARMTKDEHDRFNLAVRLFNGAMFVEAQQQLAPLLARLPGDGGVRSMSCHLGIVLAPLDPATVRNCEEGAKAAHRSARPTIHLAEALLAAKNYEGASAALVRAAELASGADDEADAWPRLAETARRASCVTLAEQAAARRPGAEAVTVWTKSTRRWMGLPTASSQCEREHVEHFREAQRMLDKNQLGVVGSRISWFPAGPARDSLSCELSLRKGALKEARRACERAVAAWPESTLGHYLLGVMAELERRPAEVELHLAQVVALDPAVDDAWVRLAGALTAQGKTEQVVHLKARFEAQFGRPLR